MTKAFPLIHLNGTSRQELIDNLSNVWNALETARDKLKLAAPHKRDYYPLPEDRWENAEKQHRERFELIDELQVNIEAEMREISEQKRK